MVLSEPSAYAPCIQQRRNRAEGPATPSQIATDTDLPIAHVSRALQKLRDHDLVDLLVSEDRRKGRVYGLTEKGEDIWTTIKAENMHENAWDPPITAPRCCRAME